MQILTRKTTFIRTLYVKVVLNGVICPQILYDIVLYVRHFLFVKFLPKCYFIYCVRLRVLFRLVRRA